MTLTDSLLFGASGALRCPVCAASLFARQREDGAVGSLLCTGERQHCYDFARTGHVHLSPRHSGGGDAKEAVVARSHFLGAGYYRLALDELIRLSKKHIGNGLIVDAGCGEGYYTGGVAAAMEGKAELCGFDLSRDAVASAAKAAKRDALPAFYAVASVFELPLRDGCADGVLNIFAPCAEAEYCRVLKDGGVLIVVGAGERHLLGLKRAVCDEVYVNEARADLPQQMTLIDQTTVEGEITVNGSEMIAALFSMTPYYWRTPRAAAQRLTALQTLTTEIAFDFKVYRK
jgi:23S rRNA (guanine745-N1)-methyltransferase